MDLPSSRADEATRHRLNQVMIDARTAESDKVLQSGKSARGSMAIRCQLDQFAREQQTVDTSGVYERALVSYTRSLELQADEAAGWVLAVTRWLSLEGNGHEHPPTSLPQIQLQSHQ